MCISLSLSLSLFGYSSLLFFFAIFSVDGELSLVLFRSPSLACGAKAVHLSKAQFLFLNHRFFRFAAPGGGGQYRTLHTGARVPTYHGQTTHLLPIHPSRSTLSVSRHASSERGLYKRGAAL